MKWFDNSLVPSDLPSSRWFKDSDITEAEICIVERSEAESELFKT